jgi:hypothetical protein
MGCIHSIWAGIELEMCIEKNEWLDLVHQPFPILVRLDVRAIASEVGGLAELRGAEVSSYLALDSGDSLLSNSSLGFQIGY